MARLQNEVVIALVDQSERALPELVIHSIPVFPFQATTYDAGLRTWTIKDEDDLARYLNERYDVWRLEPANRHLLTPLNKDV